MTDSWVSCSAWSNRTLIMVGISFRWSLDNQMRIICEDLNYERANSPGAPMAFQRSTEPYQVCCSYTDCSFVPRRSRCVWMPFMMAEENTRGRSIVHEYGAEIVKTSTIVSWTSFTAFVTERSPARYFTTLSELLILLKQATFDIISHSSPAHYLLIEFFLNYRVAYKPALSQKCS